MSLEPGVYYLQNVSGGTMLTLHGDKKGVVGFAWYRGKDQKGLGSLYRAVLCCADCIHFLHQWELGKLGDHGWFIRSLYSGNNHYLTIENGLGNGTSIVANGFPATWEIKAEPKEGEDVVWIHWPNSIFTVDLHTGSKNDGTKVHFWSRHDGRHQYWRLIRCPDEDQTSRIPLQSPSRGKVKTTTTIVTTTTTVVTRCEDEEDKVAVFVEK